jgi:hypothetical protein
MPDITFDAATHTYRVDGIVRPCVTHILGCVPPWNTLYVGIDPDVLERARQEGTATHAATALEDEGDLDWASITEDTAGTVRAWKRWRHDAGFLHLSGGIERALFHPSGYCGTLDRIGVRRGSRTTLWLVDIKRGLAGAKVAGPQTAAYAAAWQATTGETARIERCSVVLSPDGSYQEVRLSDRRDYRRFEAALELYTYAQQMGGLK